MTASTLAYPDSPSPRRAFRSALLFVLVAALIIVLVATALPAIEHSRHATDRHGFDAEYIRQCLDKSGPQIVFRDKAGMYFLLCQLPDGRWGAELTRKLSDGWHEVTAYVKGDGSWKTVTDWLIRQGAARFKGPLP